MCMSVSASAAGLCGCVVSLIRREVSGQVIICVCATVSQLSAAVLASPGVSLPCETNRAKVLLSGWKLHTCVDLVPKI